MQLALLTDFVLELRWNCVAHDGITRDAGYAVLVVQACRSRACTSISDGTLA